jgi:predicted N-acetyltransferase YhbS
MVHQLRQSKDFIPELDLVADCDGKIVGNIICSKCLVVNDENHTENRQEVIAIGPIGVLPDYQKSGIGGLLIQSVKEKAIQLGLSGIVLYGNPRYYHRFGFVNAEKYDLKTAQNTNFEEFMAFELTLESLKKVSGRCYESEAFEIDKSSLIEFEKKFTK